MKEFGSDFHRYDLDFCVANSQLKKFRCLRFYASGRHAIEAIIKQEKWKRIWMPAYFCYEVIEYIKSKEIDVILYNDYPLCENDDEVVRQIPYKEDDVLFRTDYFGLRKWRTNKGIPVPVIEDHTHGLTTDWAIRSNADWCIASLRKSLPIATGGVLWSPKSKRIPLDLKPTDDCEAIARMRYNAMDLKANYLKANYASEREDSAAKNVFRKDFIDSEQQIDKMKISGIDAKSKQIVNSMNIEELTCSKFENWKIATNLLGDRFNIIGYDRIDNWNPFSLILLLNSTDERNALLQYMVKQKIYPAILWRIPENSEFKEAHDFSDKMLSVHCDNRYNCEEITDMCNKIIGFYDTNI